MIATLLEISALINKYHRLIYAICIGVVNDAHLAEDVAQDVFERLIKNADKLLALDEQKQIAYISVVAKNRAIDVLRKEHIRHSNETEIDENSLITMDIMARNSFVDEHGFTLEMRDLILKLDSLEKDIIMMKYGLGYSYREIAEVLETKERTIIHKANTARQKLCKAIMEGDASK